MGVLYLTSTCFCAYLGHFVSGRLCPVMLLLEDRSASGEGSGDEQSEGRQTRVPGAHVFFLFRMARLVHCMFTCSFCSLFLFCFSPLGALLIECMSSSEIRGGRILDPFQEADGRYCALYLYIYTEPHNVLGCNIIARNASPPTASHA